jgi:hypothetical protein
MIFNHPQLGIIRHIVIVRLESEAQNEAKQWEKKYIQRAILSMSNVFSRFKLHSWTLLLTTSPRLAFRSSGIWWWFYFLCFSSLSLTINSLMHNNNMRSWGRKERNSEENGGLKERNIVEEITQNGDARSVCLQLIMY